MNDSMNAGLPGVLIEEIPLERIAVIKSLWDGLRGHHEMMSPYFSGRYRTMAFESRIEKLYSPGVRVLIEGVRPSPGNDLIGYCISSIDTAGNGEIDSIYVDPSYRRRGIADKLVARACAWLDREGAASRKVIVAAGNEQVYPLYRKHGFFPLFSVLSQKKQEEP